MAEKEYYAVSMHSMLENSPKTGRVVNNIAFTSLFF